jgi:hypothetical protein
MKTPRKARLCRLILFLILPLLLSNVRHAAAQGLPITQTPLDSWSFDDPRSVFYIPGDWSGDSGYPPVSFTNITASIYGDDGSLTVDSTNAAWLQYNVYEDDGTTNLTVDTGSITLWFNPSWGSVSVGGSGSGTWGQLVDAGQWTSNASYGWWSLYTDPAGTNLYFSAQNNAGTQANYLSAPIAWTPGQWHFIALTYSSTNTLLYLDGQLATNGSGMSVWPDSTVLANGFYIGSDTNGESQAHGSFDDIYTYNYVLSSNTISSTFSAFNPSYYLLDSWSFNNKSDFWLSDFGYDPISFTNLNTTLGDGTALLLDTNTTALLQYNVYESDGTTNLTVNQGSVVMWFAPSWASTNAGAVGPGAWGQLIDAGEWTSDASYGWWSLNVDPTGTNLWFSAQNAGAQTNYLCAPISWSADDWHFIALTYSASNTAVYVDGKLATNGVGMSIWPSSTVLSNGFNIGSDTNGYTQAHGIFDDVATYSIPLDATTVSNIFISEATAFTIDPFTTFKNNIVSGNAQPSSSPMVYEAITGIGSLQNIGSASSCFSSTNVWITNVVATLTGGGTNATMNLMFTIEGGSNGVPYDVFANSALTFGTNSMPWSWMGQGYQCNVYMLTNLPPTTCFLILGTPQDSDGDGLTDAYEKLVSHTNPLVADTDGDGLSDAWEVLLGTNPNFGDNATTASRLNYTYDAADWLEGISGKKTGAVSLDNEGNVLSVSQ